MRNAVALHLSGPAEAANAPPLAPDASPAATRKTKPSKKDQTVVAAGATSVGTSITIHELGSDAGQQGATSSHYRQRRCERKDALPSRLRFTAATMDAWTIELQQRKEHSTARCDGFFHDSGTLTTQIRVVWTYHQMLSILLCQFVVDLATAPEQSLLQNRCKKSGP